MPETGPAEKQTLEARTVERSIALRIEEFTVTYTKNEWRGRKLTGVTHTGGGWGMVA